MAQHEESRGPPAILGHEHEGGFQRLTGLDLQPAVRSAVGVWPLVERLDSRAEPGMFKVSQFKIGLVIATEFGVNKEIKIKVPSLLSMPNARRYTNMRPAVEMQSSERTKSENSVLGTLAI